MASSSSGSAASGVARRSTIVRVAGSVPVSGRAAASIRSRPLPYDVSARFRALTEQHPSAWIFTSATLALDGHFEHFAGRLGLDAAATLLVDFICAGVARNSVSGGSS